MITQKRLKELLCYSPETGQFIWKINASNMIKAGDVAGSTEKRGYTTIGLYGSGYSYYINNIRGN